MNVKKILTIVSAAAISCALVAGTSFAASAWSVCTPKKIGPQVDGSGTDIVRIKVIGCNSDPTDGTGFLTLKAASADQQMATVLTAMSLGKTIAVQYDNAQKDAENYNYALGVILTN
jgi:hypothetical protein